MEYHRESGVACHRERDWSIIRRAVEYHRERGGIPKRQGWSIIRRGEYHREW